MSVLETLAAWYSMSPNLMRGVATALVMSIYYAVHFERKYRKAEKVLEELKGSANGGN